jgi:hypothetical protein
VNIIFTRAIRILVFIILVIISDQGIGFVLQKLYFNQKFGGLHSLNFALNDCKADILIFGASQAQGNYDPRIISNSLGMNCYNCGQNGYGLFLSYAQIMVIMTRYTPKIIILDIGDMNELQNIAADYDKLAILQPYYSAYPQLRSLILQRGSYQRLKQISGIYPYNSLLLNLLRFNTNFDKNKNWIFDGYIPVKNKIMDVEKVVPYKMKTSSASVDTVKINALLNIIDLCKTNKVKLYIVVSPYFKEVPNLTQPVTEAHKVLMKIISNKNVPLIDMTDFKYFHDNPSCFADPAHLNEKGAILYSKLINDLLVKAHDNTR